MVPSQAISITKVFPHENTTAGTGATNVFIHTSNVNTTTPLRSSPSKYIN